MKRLSKKIGFLLAFLVLCVILIFVRSYYRNTSELEDGTIFRPEDFPECLIAPENAQGERYSTPSNTKMKPGTFHMVYKIRDPYPGECTYKFIEDTLARHGWFKLRHILLQPERVINQGWDISRIKEPGWELRDWSEIWINEKYESAYVILNYRFPVDGEPDLDTLYVAHLLSGPETWVRSYVLRYKELHPEEFEPNLVGG